MEITFLGAGSVKLAGRNLSLITDPIAAIKQPVNVALVTSPGSKAPDGVGNMVIDSPGEYEVAGSMIVGVPVRLVGDDEGERGTAFAVDIDDIRVAVLGGLAPGVSNKQIESLGQVDVLILPVGGGGLVLEPSEAAKVANQIEPKYIVPVHYDDGVTKYDKPQAGLEAFLAEIGSKPEPVAKLKLTAKDLPEETTVVVLERA